MSFVREIPGFLLSESSPGLTVWCGSPSRWRVQLGRCGACGGVAVAPEQAVFALAVCVGGDAGDVGLGISDEEGAASGRDEAGVVRGNRATANASICAVVLKGRTEP